MSTGAVPFLELAYRNPSFPHLGIECFPLSELRRRMRPGFFARIQRPRFHLLALYQSGEGSQEVDFVQLTCRAGTLIHVHPGQVLRYLDVERAEAAMLLFTPEFLEPSNSPLDAPRREAVLPLSHLHLAEAGLETVRAGFAALEREYRLTDGGERSASILRHLLMALLLQIGREAPPPLPPSLSPRQQETFARFRSAVERDFRHTRTLEDYARQLGCTPKTLNRASQGASGLPAKRFIDARVGLEAKRLLAHTGLSSSEIARQLGFSEATNFIKFFRRETGTLPGVFRHASQEPPAP